MGAFASVRNVLSVLAVAILAAAPQGGTPGKAAETPASPSVGGTPEQPRLQNLLTPPGKRLDDRTLFNLIDTDGDGRITRSEFDLKRMDAFFIRDANGDGKLSRAEFPGISDALFAKTDTDGDGFISGIEFNQADWLAFDAIDINGDGVIDFDEFVRFGKALD